MKKSVAMRKYALTTRQGHETETRTWIPSFGPDASALMHPSCRTMHF
jgi:hypothetical protein